MAYCILHRQINKRMDELTILPSSENPTAIQTDSL